MASHKFTGHLGGFFFYYLRDVEVHIFRNLMIGMTETVHDLFE